jgi:hypothetical protein
MIRLEFKATQPAQMVVLGPAPWFRVAGNFIRQGPKGDIVGAYRNHFWEVGGGFFTRYDCREMVMIHFEDAAGGPSEKFGPYEQLWVADGVFYSNNRLFAKYHEHTVLWHCYNTDTYWPTLVITPSQGGS